MSRRIPYFASLSAEAVSERNKLIKTVSILNNFKTGKAVFRKMHLPICKHCDIIRALIFILRQTITHRRNFNRKKGGPLTKTIVYEHPAKKGGKQMNELIRQIESEFLKKEVPSFNVGDTVRVFNKIIEGEKERIQIFEGTVMKRQNGGVRETFTVRRLSNGVGVEKTWPLHSPRVEKIEVVRRGVVRRAKLFYLRKRVGKSAKVKEAIIRK